MFTFDKNIFFFLINPSFILSLQTEIKFHINNVPSLFRCEANGALFYLNHFPNHGEFQQIIKKNNRRCDISLSSVDRRAIVELNKMELLCERVQKNEHKTEFLFFSSKCSRDLCKQNLPLSAAIVTETKPENINIDRIDSIFHVNESTQLLVVHMTSAKYLVRRIGFY